MENVNKRISKTQSGREGEERAAQFLMAFGYSILHRNWRTGRLELDIVALKDDVLHFVEVKFRQNQLGGYPESRVSVQKFKRLQIAANAYRIEHPGYEKIQFDIISIIHQNDDGVEEIFLIEDVFYW